MRERRLNNTISDGLRAVMARLGDDLTAARKARGFSQSDLAERMHVSRKLVSRLESGDSTVSFGAYAAAAWIMGLEKNLMEAFAQERDPVFQREARLGLNKRIRKSDETGPDLDF
jgi:transcriptional regulator with XRE-family HTH domain